MNIQKGEKREKMLLAEELRKKLEWYTMQASEEEYDEKAVESILYLLDNMEPIKEEAAPQAEDAWKRFQEYVKQQEGTEAASELGIDVREVPGKQGMENKVSERLKALVEPEKAAENISPAVCRKSGEIGSFILHYKYIAAIAAILMVLSLLGTAQAVADGNTGFFHWLKRDSTGTQMVTSPDDLSGVANKEETYLYYNIEDVPEWAQEWLKIDTEFAMPENYEWQRYEGRELSNFRKITSCYFDSAVEKTVLIGMVLYYDKISLNTEGFVDYIYVDSYEIDHNQMHVYSKTEETGIKYYVICFYEDNYKFFMQGQDNLEELKGLVEQYLFCIKNAKIENNL